MPIRPAAPDASEEPLPPVRRAPEGEEPAGPRRAAVWFATLATIAAVGLARDLLVPIVLAGLLACLLSPLTLVLERRRVPRPVAATFSALLFAGLLGITVWLLASSAIDVSHTLPEYRERIRTKLDGLAQTLFRSKQATDELKELANGTPEPTGAASGKPPAPVRVRVVDEPEGMLGRLGEVFGPALPALGMTGLVLLLAVFLLVFRYELRARFLRLVSLGQIAITSRAVDDAVARIARFLSATFMVNVAFAVPIALALWWIGVPNPIVWGLLAGLLRFIPVVGVWIGAIPPLLLAFAVHDGWLPLWQVLGSFLVIEVLIANVVEPLVFGHHTGISPLAVVLSTLFWTWLWGPVGLAVAVPLTVCLAVAGRYVRALQFLDVLMGAASPLAPNESFYERVLAYDDLGARNLVRARLAERTPEQVLEDDVLPALAAASVDHAEGRLGATRFRAACDVAEEALLATGLAAPAPAEGAERPAPRLLLAPVAADADAVACRLLADRLEARGVRTEVAPVTTTAGELADQLEKHPVPVVLLAGLPPRSLTRLRYIAQRIRRDHPRQVILGALLAHPGEDAPEPEDERGAALDGLDRRVVDVLQRAVTLAAPPPPPPPPTHGGAS